MESEPGAPAATASSTGTTTATTGSTTSSSSTTAVSSSSSTSNTTTTTTTTSTTSNSSSNSSSSSSSNTSSTTSSSTTAGRQAVPQISVYSGIPDRQTVQVSVVIKLLSSIWSVCDMLTLRPHSSTLFALLPSVGVLYSDIQASGFCYKNSFWWCIFKKESEGNGVGGICLPSEASQMSSNFAGCLQGRNAFFALVPLTPCPQG